MGGKVRKYFFGAKNELAIIGIYEKIGLICKKCLKIFMADNKQNVFNFRGGLKHPVTYDRIILLIRDPYDAFISEWNRENSGKHTGIAPEK